MKKVFSIIVLAVVATASVFAAEAPKFPGWKNAKQEDIAAYRDWAVSMNYYHTIFNADIMCAINSKAPTTYQQFCSIVDACAKKLDFIKDDNVILAKKQFPCCRNEFISEAWNFCRSNPGYYDFYFIIGCAKDLNLSKEVQYNELLKCITNYNYRITDIRKAIDRIIDLADSQDPVQVKKDLQRLNRRFSKNLLMDKTAWEPVIALIRTTLETY